MSTIGYARISTDHQSLDAQRDALEAEGCERIFTDQLTGDSQDRPGLRAMFDFARSGDLVVVVALDRLGRSLSGVIRPLDDLTAAGVLLRSLREGIDYSTPAGKMLAGIFAALAGYERDLMHERANAARGAARARGQHVGRPPRLTEAQVRQLRALHAAGEPVGAIAATFGVGRSTAYRALQAAGAEGPRLGGGRVTEPEVVLPAGYPELLDQLKSTVAAAQWRAQRIVNTELLALCRGRWTSPVAVVEPSLETCSPSSRDPRASAFRPSPQDVCRGGTRRGGGRRARKVRNRSMPDTLQA